MKQLPLIRPVFGEAEVDAVRRCLESGHVTQGPFVAEFERRFAELHGVRHALAVTSCTTAMHAALLALGIGPGDEVVVPAFTWVSTAHAVEYVGATPVFADIRATDFLVDPGRVEALFTPRTRAVMVVHLFGLMAGMDAILAVTRERGVAVVEDAACAAGSLYKGRAAGSIGDVGCFSFHPRKVITTGEGGMLTTNDDAIAARLAVLRNHGITPCASDGPWQMPAVDACGHNFRLSDIQAAIGVAQLGRMPAILSERRRIALRYAELLARVPGIALPTEPAHSRHTWQSYVVRVTEGGEARRNSVMALLQERGIQSRPGTQAVPRLGYYAGKYGLGSPCCPVAALCEDTTITLPVVDGMGEEDMARVCDALRDAMRGD